ncbi:Uncharacterised protein [Mycobacterium tuberculosis]|nr:Uncharacterised protein [Mycobacterium tuberculosis]
MSVCDARAAGVWYLTSVVATCLGDPVHRYRVPFTSRDSWR